MLPETGPHMLVTWFFDCSWSLQELRILFVNLQQFPMLWVNGTYQFFSNNIYFHQHSNKAERRLCEIVQNIPSWKWQNLSLQPYASACSSKSSQSDLPYNLSRAKCCSVHDDQRCRYWPRMDAKKCHWKRQEGAASSTKCHDCWGLIHDFCRIFAQQRPTFRPSFLINFNLQQSHSLISAMLLWNSK